MADRRIEELAHKFGLSNGQAKRRYRHRHKGGGPGLPSRLGPVAGTGKRGKEKKKK